MKVKLKKRIKLIIIVFVLLVICACVILFFGVQRRDDLTVSEMLQSHIGDYRVEEELKDGNIIITFQAPDFSRLVIKMQKQIDYQDISTTDIEKVIEENPELVKEYRISVEKLDKENIEKAFSNQIAYEMLIQAIEQSGEMGGDND